MTLKDLKPLPIVSVYYLVYYLRVKEVIFVFRVKCLEDALGSL